MKAFSTLLAVVLVVATSAASPELAFMADGNKVAISPKDEKRVIGMIEEIVSSANFNSRDHATMFREADTNYWRPLEQIRSGPHILLRYAAPHVFKTVGGEIIASEVWLDLRNEPRVAAGAVYPGPITLLNEDGPIRLTKEGGYLLLGLGLDIAVYPHLPKIIQNNMDRSRKGYEEYQKQQ